MDQATIDTLVDLLQQRRIDLEEGLADDEIARAEGTYGFRFPPDLRALLQYALPDSDGTSRGFPDWRDGAYEVIKEQLDWPTEGICFDIEHNDFWMGEWGPKPRELSDALALARREIAKAPVLIPVYGHRYLPDEPQLAGNPVLSVWQTDIIYYGRDLEHYFINEFSYYKPPWTTPPVRPIRFWSKLASW